MSFVELFNEDEIYAGKGIIGKIFDYKRKLMYKYILSNLPEDKNITILDIGSRDGAFIDFLRNHGYKKITALDIKPIRADISYGDIENLHLKDIPFDVVTIIGVLEHLYETVLAIKNLKGIYKKMIIINVPNEPWWSFYIGMSPPRCHVVSFSRDFLEHHLGKINKYKLVFFKRELICIWKKEV